MASVTFKKIQKAYSKDCLVVKDFNLEIKDKEFVVLVGPSGCGKSTTLRMVAGLEEITDGELYIGGKLINNIQPKDRDIAMVFQNYALYPHMTVYENMAFALKLRKVSKSEIDKKVRHAAEILGITEYLKRKPKELSGGQRQRVAIGRAIVRNPQVFLMDEPLSNLDAKLRNQMRTEIVLLRKRIDTTFIYVTHDQIEAMTLGDRIVVMKDGDIQQIGTPRDVFLHPVNMFVAGFIGTPQMNFFDSQLIVKNGEYFVKICDQEIQLSQAAKLKLKEKQVGQMDVVVGIRPEDISIAVPGKKPDCLAHVLMTEMMGNEIYVHANIGSNVTVIRLASSIIDEYGLNNISKNEELRCCFNKERIHLFDKKTEQALLED
ncbi:MAG: sn-glycerol-3-phosphate ABC transporter ATP-binding protein UgpC [Eubacteriales bacterium]